MVRLQRSGRICSEAVSYVSYVKKPHRRCIEWEPTRPDELAIARIRGECRLKRHVGRRVAAEACEGHHVTERLTVHTDRAVRCWDADRQQHGREQCRLVVAVSIAFLQGVVRRLQGLN